MRDWARARREVDLVRYYSQEARARTERALPAERVQKLGEFLDRLAREGRGTVLEVGCGPGRDGQRFRAADLAYAGVDLTPVSVGISRARGLCACVASALRLPFADGIFDAAWTMSTLMHLDHVDFNAALGEMVRVLAPGSPVAIGIWGAAQTHQHLLDDGTGFWPARFFSYRTDAVLLAALRDFGAVEEFETWPGGEPVHYQWAVLRTPDDLSATTSRAPSRGRCPSGPGRW